MIKKLSLREIIKFTLAEDMPRGDITTDLIMQEHVQKSQANLVAKEPGIFYGTEIIQMVFEVLDPTVEIKVFKQNGASISTSDIICQLNGNVNNLLKAERTMLNFVQRLSGVATLTRRFVDAVSPSKIDIVDTRKTTPLFRSLEKKAVLAGGGLNHRMSLSDMILIKDNHLAYLRQIGQIDHLSRFLDNFKKSRPEMQVEVEVDSLAELKTLNLAGVDIIMLDNFPITDIVPAHELCKEKGYIAKLEVSGNVTLETISQYKNLPIDRISIGSITHSPKSLDLSLEF